MPKVREAYKGRVHLAFHARGHKYIVNGERVPSVTTVTGALDKPALPRWAVNLACEHVMKELLTGQTLSPIALYDTVQRARGAWERTRTEAADIGGAVHDYAEAYARIAIGEEIVMPCVPESGLEAVRAFHKFEQDHKVQWLDVERLLYSRLHQYAGQADLLCRIGDELVLADYKTGSHLYPTHRLQIGAYYGALIEEGEWDVERGLLIQLDKKTGDYALEWMNRYEMDEAFDIFTQLRQVYAWTETQ